MSRWNILMVEDGSIDIEDLQEFIDKHNLKIKIVVCRQGSRLPYFLDKESEKQNRFLIY